MAEATKDLFELQTQKKETQHKIDRLRDYERQIEQHVKMQRLWYVGLQSRCRMILRCYVRDSDFQKFNDRGEEIQSVKSQYRKMEMRLESYEKTQEQMDEQAR